MGLSLTASGFELLMCVMGIVGFVNGRYVISFHSPFGLLLFKCCTYLYNIHVVYSIDYEYSLILSTHSAKVNLS